jgi:hypothetical protein
LKPFGSKTIEQEFVHLRFGLELLLRGNSKVALIIASFLPGRRFFHLGRNR